MTPVLSVRRLTTKLQLGKSFVTAVDDVSFDLHAGKTLALVGESGCGKSMTALSIMRLLPSPPALPSKGEILYSGKNLLDLSEKEMRCLRGYKLAMIFQDPHSALNPVYPVGSQLIEVGIRHLGLDPDEASEKAIHLLEEVGITDPEEKMRRFPHQLSGGLKQRVMIAMALMGDPDVLIADEPTTALDVTVQSQVLDLLAQLQVTRHMAILLITHDMGVVAEMADEVIVMYGAKAVEMASVDTLFNQMAHPYTRGLFASRPKREVKLQAPIPGNVPPLHRMPSGCRFHPRCTACMPQCKEKIVPQFDLGKGHKVACFLYSEHEGGT